MSVRKELEIAEMKAVAFSVMVDIAEEKFKIPIRKNYNAKSGEVLKED